MCVEGDYVSARIAQFHGLLMNMSDEDTRSTVPPGIRDSVPVSTVKSYLESFTCIYNHVVSSSTENADI